MVQMNLNNLKLLFLVLILIININNLFAKNSISKKSKMRDITLQELLEQGLRESSDQKKRDTSKELIELDWSNARDKFLFPKLSLNFKIDSHRILKFKDDQYGDSITDGPKGSLGLVLEDYSLYNWGRDQLQYHNSRDIYKREMQRLGEDKIKLKHMLIGEYSNLLRAKKIEQVKKEFLRHASFIYRMGREKVKIGKTSKQDYYQSRGLYLIAKDQYAQSQIDTSIASSQINYRMQYSHDTSYIITEELNYKSLKLTEGEASKLSHANNSSVKDARTDLHNNKRNYELQKKNNLPLPKISLNLGSYRHNFGSSNNFARYKTTDDRKDISIVASVNATWSIFGDGGFFNSRKTKKAFIKSKLSNLGLQETKLSTTNLITQSYRRINYLEQHLKQLIIQVNNMQQIFDIAINNYINKKTTFLTVSTSLNDLIRSKVDLENSKYFHIKEKITLSDLVMLEDFPGENFEKSVKKIK